MKLYKLECTTEDGDKETNGYFIIKFNAEIAKIDLDEDMRNIKYGIVQHIIEIQTED